MAKRDHLASSRRRLHVKGDGFLSLRLKALRREEKLRASNVSVGPQVRHQYLPKPRQFFNYIAHYAPLVSSAWAWRKGAGWALLYVCLKKKKTVKKNRQESASNHISPGGTQTIWSRTENDRWSWKEWLLSWCFTLGFSARPGWWASFKCIYVYSCFVTLFIPLNWYHNTCWCNRVWILINKRYQLITSLWRGKTKSHTYITHTLIVFSHAISSLSLRIA